MQTNQKKVQELHFETTVEKLEMVVVAMMMMVIAMTFLVAMTVATEVMAIPLTKDRSKVEADCEGEYSLK